MARLRFLGFALLALIFMTSIIHFSEYDRLLEVEEADRRLSEQRTPPHNVETIRTHAQTPVKKYNQGLRSPPPIKPGSIHVVFSTECLKFHDWQSIGLFHTLQKTNPGLNATRLLSCDERIGVMQAKSRYSEIQHHVGQYFLTPIYNPHIVTGDNYPPYTRSFSLELWVQKQLPAEETIVVLDPDFLALTPWPSDLRAMRGRPLAQFYPIKVYWSMPPMSQLCDRCAEYTEKELENFQVGPPYVIHRDDLVALAPVWREMTEKIRQHKHTMDFLEKLGDSWIVDMFSYALACIHLGFRHDVRYDLMVSFPHGERFWDKSFDLDGSLHWQAKPFGMHYCQPYSAFLPSEAHLPKDKRTRFYKHDLHDDDLTACGARVLNDVNEGRVGSNGLAELVAPTDRHDRREFWMFQTTVGLLNDALEWYQGPRCG